MEINVDKKKIRDHAFKGLVGVLFVGLVYVSAFSSGDGPGEGDADRINTELPDGKAEPLLDKMGAYESEPLARSEERRMRTLNDYAFSLKEGDGTGGETPGDMAGYANPGIEAIQRSVHAREESDEIGTEYQRIQAEKEELRRELARVREESRRRNRLEEREVMLGLSAGYTGKGPAEPLPEAVDRDRETVEVTRPPEEVVSTLSDELLLDNPYNFGFNTAVGSGYQGSSNTIRAAVSGNQTITVGDRVTLRLLEPLQAGSAIIPRNHLVSGISRVQGDRMDIVIESLEYSGNIIPVSLRVYDTDGLPGIHCPGSAELDALKEGAASIGSGLGTSVSFTHSAGQQVAMDLARGVMGGASQYISKKMRTVRISLRSNYEVLLLPKKN